MLYCLQLPKPSEQLTKLVIESACARPSPVNRNDVPKRWKESFPKYENLNVAKGEFFSSKFIDTSIKEEFQSFFNYEIFPTIGIFRNTLSESVASYPPHKDYLRSFSLNYYVEQGGDNVTTVLYEQKDSDDVGLGNKLIPNIIPYDSLNVKSQYVFDNKWYLFPGANYYHSIENIQTTRILISLSFLYVSIDTFLKSLADSIGIEPMHRYSQ